MPIVWGVDHAARLVSATASGDLDRADIEEYLDGLVAAATLSYRKILDMAQGRLALSREDMAALGARIRVHEGLRPMGSVAVVVGSTDLYEQVRLFEDVVAARRPLRVFRDATTAYAWLAVGLAEGVELTSLRRAAAARQATPTTGGI